MINEFEMIDWIKKTFSDYKGAKVSIGDDAAVLKPSGLKGRLISTDLIIDGVDFRTNELSPQWIGRKALAINLSDMAAMGAKPKEFVISLGLTKKQDAMWLKKFYQGLLKLARTHKVTCVGGDMSGAKDFLACVTILGEVNRYDAVLRSGAKTGDYIGVTGSLGGSILKKHYAFEPRVREGIFLAKKKYATSMMDISDGFAQDLEHILKASKLRAQVDLSSIPISRTALQMSKNNKNKALKKALSDGEDFELLFTVPKKKKENLELEWKKMGFKVPLVWVGKMMKGAPEVEWHKQGQVMRNFSLNQKGYQHFK